jgi:hypothetical protein
VATQASQTQTAWGRIWDALPPSFPIPPGSEPTETGDQPATAVLQLPVAIGDAATAAAWIRDHLVPAGFASVNVDGPLENGGYTVSVVGACQIEIDVTPAGDTVVARILYGAGCPWR